ncbi:MULTISPECIES: DUF4097 family beta strand repeat-containing protein [unclassified Saccharicrinis]|uniref:DUF4097 family beta strand repeat-containing protein n=1 Tax=unclassified Saccharicrinis TaxID=2646859 RepID=UPI003D35266F
MQKLKIYFVVAAVLLSMNNCIINEVSGHANIVIDQAEIDFENVASLVVNGSFCNVNIDSHSSDNLLFKGEIKSSKQRDDIKIKYKQNGAKLVVWIERPKTLRGSFKGVLDFKVPTNTNIDVDNSSGSMYVANIGQSTIELKASSGSIRVENVDSHLEAKTSSGSLKINNIRGDLTCISSSGSQSIVEVAGDVISKLSSGSISMEDIKGNVVSESSSGSQSIQLVKGNIKATASSGSIHLNDIHGHVKAKASSGSIKLNNITGALDLYTSSGGQYGEEIMLTGNSSFKSSSGGIKIGVLNSADELSFDLTASSGGLQAKGINGRKELKINKGAILITGASSSGGQKYY